MKASFTLILLFSLAFTACKRNIALSSSGGSWTFRGTQYSTYYCDAVYGDMSVSTSGQNGPNGNMTISFGGTGPFSGFDTGTYRLVSIVNGGFPNGPHQMGIALVCSNGTYNSTGGNGNNQTVHVGLINGKLNVSGSGLELVNVVPPYDSSMLTLNVTQIY